MLFDDLLNCIKEYNFQEFNAFWTAATHSDVQLALASYDENRLSLLHLACWTRARDNDDTRIIELLLKSMSIDQINAKGSEGFTALNIAVHIKYFNAWILLFKAGASDDFYTLADANFFVGEMEVHFLEENYPLSLMYIDTALTIYRRLSPDHMDSLYEKIKNIIRFVDPITQQLYLKNAINNDDKKLVVTLLKAGLIPSEEMYHDAQGEVKKFFDYYPGLTRHGWRLKQLRQQPEETMWPFSLDDKVIRYPSIFECVMDPGKLQYLSGGLDNLIDDEADTTDEESSDDELDKEIVVNPRLRATENYQMLKRGVHFSPAFFTSRQRKVAQQPESHQRTIYSLGTMALARELNNDFSSADTKIKDQFSRLQNNTTALTECTVNGKKRAPRRCNNKPIAFENQLMHLIQVYVDPRGFDGLFNNNLIITNFGFPVSKNVFLSTSFDTYVADSYASNARGITGLPPYNPRIRKSTGVVKHNTVGYIETYCMDITSSHVTDVNQLYREEKIGIAHNFRYNQEVLVQSSIPEENVYSYELISVSNNRRSLFLADKTSRRIEKSPPLHQSLVLR